MVKLLGAGLILFAAFAIGFQLKQRLAEHVRQLLAFQEMLLMLDRELSFARTALDEAFLHIAGQGKEPFSGLLMEVAGRMRKEREATLQEIWRSAVEHRREEFYFSEEEFYILTGLSENFGYLDVQMQVGNIALYVRQVEYRISKARDELALKQKMYQYLSVMCGLFLILILI